MRAPKLRALALSALLVAVGIAVGRGLAPRAAHAPDQDRPDRPADVAPTFWTCSMHPQVRLPEPGRCPICAMDLIPAGGGGEEDGARVLRLTPAAAALAEIETARVERRSVAHEVKMVGKVALDETRLAYITAWVAGRLDRLFVDYTGVEVRADDHLVEIYSPTLYSAQQELLQAIATAKRLEGSSLDILRTTSDRTVVSAREKLRLYGLSDEQIRATVERGVPDRHVTLRAPFGGVVVHKNAVEGMYVEEGSRIFTIADLSKVWVLLEAYESDLAWLRYGQDVEFEVAAYPGETFHGRVAFIDPLLDDRTRTVKVRLNVDNAGRRLKPEMFVSARAAAVLTAHGKVVDEDLAGKWMCPMHPEVVADAEEPCPECEMQLVPAAELGFAAEPEEGESLVVPASAPLVTGKRAVVYVRVPGRDAPTFEGREIALGPRAGDWYVVRGGLLEGEEVVVKGNFKIDSELQIRARPSMMSAPEAPPAGAGALPRSAVPAVLRRRLGEAVEAYLGLQRALAVDEEGSAPAAALVAALAGADAGALEGRARGVGAPHLSALRAAADAVVGADGLEARRARFAALSDELLDALEVLGWTRDGDPLAVFHCPMALGSEGALGDGADWIQLDGEVANPYLGSEMPRCGSRVAPLEPEE